MAIQNLTLYRYLYCAEYCPSNLCSSGSYKHVFIRVNPKSNMIGLLILRGDFGHRDDTPGEHHVTIAEQIGMMCLQATGY